MIRLLEINCCVRTLTAQPPHGRPSWEVSAIKRLLDERASKPLPCSRDRTGLLQRDVRDIANIEGLTALPRLLKLLASRASGLLNLADISRNVSIPHTTLKRYMALLEATFLIRLLPARKGGNIMHSIQVATLPASLSMAPKTTWKRYPHQVREQYRRVIKEGAEHEGPPPAAGQSGHAVQEATAHRCRRPSGNRPRDFPACGTRSQALNRRESKEFIPGGDKLQMLLHGRSSRDSGATKFCRL